MRDAVAAVEFPLPTATAREATTAAEMLQAQLDDYLLPRLTLPGAPLLVVVGGSTGAGKSTLVNSLVRAPVSAAGVLRPTTRAPVLVCHPADAGWFRGSPLLENVARAAEGGAGSRGTRSRLDRRAVAPQLVTAPALRPGVAFLDAPDIDSTVAANRTLAHRLFAAADLWLFATTANRYADAVPWRLLRAARDRRAVVAMVLARVPLAATDEVAGLLTHLLRQQQLAEVPVFVLPETRVARQGMLPESATAPLRRWFDALAGDEAARGSVIRHTLNGALSVVAPQLGALAAAADEQLAVAEALAEQVGLAYGVARGQVEQGLRADPATPAVPAPTAGEPADRTGSAPATTTAAHRSPARHRQTAGEAALIQLVQSAAADAAEQTESAWRSHPVGAALLGPEAVGANPDLPRQVQRVAREHPPAEWPTRVGDVLDAEAAQWLSRLAGVPLDGGPAIQLRQAAAALAQHRSPADPAAESPTSPATVPATSESGW
ncbi:dynamin family protein [Natronosporangium hydrolyticum]|uniref:Dynamin family protein n=1 Tax=Natronosporangium hydrolyticum TaxID=2811111 RepID=A0A895YB88_9ACTN|nr:dynamin family protein [Natronosporangium hydrolyticum]QSB15017.1 dynamin family protein [Natronosporangium hydrolyticum]